MQDFDIMATHSCGHQERHTGGTSGGVQSMLDFFATRKCSTCRPLCGFCNRTGDREKMLIVDGATFCNEWCHLQSLNPTHYREHNDIEIPGFLRHWSDTSWHNDLCGSSQYTLVKGESGRAQLDIRVWVERADPAERDDPASNRFIIEFLVDGENPNGDDCDWLYAGDDEAIAAQWTHAAEIVVCGPDADDDPAAAEMVSKIRELIATTVAANGAPDGPDMDEFDLENEK